RDRRHLSQDGLIVVVSTIDADSGLLISGPDIVSRGFVYVRENEELMEEARQLVTRTLSTALRRGRNIDQQQVKTRVRDELSKFLFARTGRKPMILPVIMDV
ncbi:MAG: RNase J family beta-CASP ribonuclease, partial [Clostridia bacterium]|nr:RNase J family beta-CASP ribonuclease [Clostridia bacterium]